MGAFQNSPSQSPRLALRKVDIDIDGDNTSTGRQTPPRNTLQPLAESQHSPSDSDLAVRTSEIDIMTDSEKEAVSRKNSDKSDTAVEASADNVTKPIEDINPHEKLTKSESAPLLDEKPAQIVAVDEEDDEDDEEESESKQSLKVGDVVKISESLEGQVRFYGKTQFADGIWVGIALTVPEGKICLVSSLHFNIFFSCHKRCVSQTCVFCVEIEIYILHVLHTPSVLDTHNANRHTTM